MPRGFLLNSIPVNTPAGSELYKRYIPSGDILEAPRRLQRPNSRSIDCRICVRLAFSHSILDRKTNIASPPTKGE